MDIASVTTVSDLMWSSLMATSTTLTPPLPAVLSIHTGPLLVIEDGPHTYCRDPRCAAIFDRYLQPGDYIVVEDGIAKDLGYRWLRNGPNRAVRQFLPTATTGTSSIARALRLLRPQRHLEPQRIPAPGRP